MNCYNCGIELTEETNHEEHIPAKNLFRDYPNEYKVDLLKVTACYACNIELYSKIDQEIRDAIAIQNENNDLQNEMTRKAVKSIMRKSNWKDRIFSTDNGKSFDVSFSYNDIEKLHIKNFKGLFFAMYGRPISNEYEIKVIAEGDEENVQLQNANAFLREYVNFEKGWTHIGHSEVFQYKLKAMIEENDGLFYDGENINDAIGFVCIMEYHQTLKPLVIANKTEFINQ